jgi:hypothetical protein
VSLKSDVESLVALVANFSAKPWCTIAEVIKFKPV